MGSWHQLIVTGMTQYALKLCGLTFQNTDKIEFISLTFTCFIQNQKLLIQGTSRIHWTFYPKCVHLFKNPYQGFSLLIFLTCAFTYLSNQTWSKGKFTCKFNRHSRGSCTEKTMAILMLRQEVQSSSMVTPSGLLTLLDFKNVFLSRLRTS